MIVESLVYKQGTWGSWGAESQSQCQSRDGNPSEPRCVVFALSLFSLLLFPRLPSPPPPGLEPWLGHVVCVPSLTTGLLGCGRRGAVLRGLNGGSRGRALRALGLWLPAALGQPQPSSFLSLLLSSPLFAWTSGGAGRKQ